MAKETNIEWCDSTVNPTTGCEGCELWNGADIRHCYAGNLHENRLAKSYPGLYAGNFQEVRLAPGRMKAAAAWPDLRGTKRPDKPWLDGQPRCIFVGDMGDFCSRAVPEEYILDEIIGAITTPAGSRHFWLLLTKQIHRLCEISKRIGGLPVNCMAMTTITNQSYADSRLPWLMKTKCHWRGVSAEPLHGPVDLGFHKLGARADAWMRCPRCKGTMSVPADGGGKPCGICFDSPAGQGGFELFDWLICGFQSGPNSIPGHVEHIESLIYQSRYAGIACFVKQLGDKPLTDDLTHWNKPARLLDDRSAYEITLRDKKGGDPHEWPESLRVREFPT